MLSSGISSVISSISPNPASEQYLSKRLYRISNSAEKASSPSEVKSHEKNLAAIALTDHDTVDGLDEAISYTKERYPDMELVPGIEFSTVEEGKDVHVVGLFIDHHNEVFMNRLKQFIDSR